MRAVVQRVSRAQVRVSNDVVGHIGPGLLVLLGVGMEDTQSDADHLAAKVIGLRIFEDAGGKMNRAVGEIEGGVLVVSQFTLYGDVRRGQRPSFHAAAPPEKAARFTIILWNASASRVCAARQAGFRRGCRSNWSTTGP
jgi:D-tyrosyl-tRNA(Tyr) deacylase